MRFMKQGPEALIPEEVPVPQVRPGWSLIRIRTFGLNHSKIFTRQGLSLSVTFPRILGIGCTGETAETTDPERRPEGRLPHGRDGTCLRWQLCRACTRS